MVKKALKQVIIRHRRMFDFELPVLHDVVASESIKVCCKPIHSISMLLLSRLSPNQHSSVSRDQIKQKYEYFRRRVNE